jgi:hypothetical protein
MQFNYFNNKIQYLKKSQVITLQSQENLTGKIKYKFIYAQVHMMLLLFMLMGWD